MAGAMFLRWLNPAAARSARRLGHRARGGAGSLAWPVVASYLAPTWSLGYGVLALSWVIGAGGYPFVAAVDKEASLTLLSGVPPVIGASGLAGSSLMGAVAGWAMLRGVGRGSGRVILLTFGALMAATLALLIPDYRILVVLAYTPIFLIGAPFGWPPEASLADLYAEFTWPFMHQLLAITGGVVWAGATIAYRRRTAGACPRCGRTASHKTWFARWANVAVALAVVIPLLYAITRWAWALGMPLGVTEDFLRAGEASGMWLAGAMLASLAALGALLTTGLIACWGEIFPAWLPVIGRRRVPPAVAIVPASVMAIIITAAGLMFVRLVLLGRSPFRMDEWGAVAPELLWPIWGLALGVATLAYHERRQPRCTECGRGPDPDEHVGCAAETGRGSRRHGTDRSSVPS